MPETIRYSYKLVVVGDPSVGKTSLIRRYADKKFDESYLPTIGADFTIKKIEFQEADIIRAITLSIWDMGGHQRFERIRDHYYLDANAAFIVFDVSRKDTFDHLPVWLEDIRSHCGKIPCILLQNKNDLENKMVTQQDMDKLIESQNLKFYKTSAKTGENVEKIFDDIAQTCFKEYDSK